MILMELVKLILIILYAFLCGFAVLAIFVFIFKLFKLLLLYSFSLFYFVDVNILKRIIKKQTTMQDFFEISEINNDNKKQLLSYIWKNYPSYNEPYFYNLEAFKNDEHLYKMFSKNNEEYHHKVSTIYISLLKVKSDIEKIIEEQNTKFWNKYIAFQNNKD